MEFTCLLGIIHSTMFALIYANKKPNRRAGRVQSAKLGFSLDNKE